MLATLYDARSLLTALVMSTSPALVVDTLNRYLLLDSPNVNFLDSIDLQYADSDEQPAAFVLTFTFQHATHNVNLLLVHTTHDNGTHWHISDVDASHPQLVSGHSSPHVDARCLVACFNLHCSLTLCSVAARCSVARVRAACIHRSFPQPPPSAVPLTRMCHTRTAPLPPQRRIQPHSPPTTHRTPTSYIHPTDTTSPVPSVSPSQPAMPRPEPHVVICGAHIEPIDGAGQSSTGLFYGWWWSCE